MTAPSVAWPSSTRTRRRWPSPTSSSVATPPDAPRGVPRVLETGEPEVMEEIPDELLVQSVRDGRQLGILRELGLRSYMIVLMIARGRTLGAITLVSAESGRRYGPEDLEVAETLVRRAAMTMDNARLYEGAQREIAERERAQEELRQSEDRLRLATGATRLGTFDYHLNTGELLWDARCKEIFGLPPDAGVDHDTFLAGLHDLAGEPRGRLSAEYRVRGKGGDWRYFEAIDVNLLEDPVIGGIVVNLRDVTERWRRSGRPSAAG